MDHVMCRANDYIIIMHPKIDACHLKVALLSMTTIIPMTIYKHVDKHVWVSAWGEFIINYLL